MDSGVSTPIDTSLLYDDYVKPVFCSSFSPTVSGGGYPSLNCSSQGFFNFSPLLITPAASELLSLLGNTGGSWEVPTLCSNDISVYRAGAADDCLLSVGLWSLYSYWHDKRGVLTHTGNYILKESGHCLTLGQEAVTQICTSPRKSFSDVYNCTASSNQRQAYVLNTA